MAVYISRDGSEALEHYGVKGMKWGVRKKTKYDTTQRGRTTLSTTGEMLIANDVNLYGRKGRAHRKAIRASNRAAYAYRQDLKTRARSKHELAVRGNAYTETYNKEIAKGRTSVQKVFNRLNHRSKPRR